VDPGTADLTTPPPAELFSLAGRTALVTGGSRGLGRAIAHGYAAAGAQVVISSRHAESCEKVVAEIAARGGKAVAIPAHVGHWEDLSRLAEAAIAAFGGLDILVNNAGMSPTYSSVGEVSEALFDKTLAVNLKGPFRLSALVGQHMQERGRGSIINVGSTGSIRPHKDIIPYAAAKAGLHTMSLAFADAFGPQVRVNAILPGRFRTDVTRGWAEAQLRGGNARLRRIGKPAEIIGAAVYLASDASSYVTGSAIVLDGGSF
jgi:NAD(P)-dependent dehydrogenase (short-subunit alcohol dehydrogenase family)